MRIYWSPEDWDAAIALESKTNPRLAQSIGRLDLIPPARRVTGPGASYLMSPFTHASTDNPGRFHDGHYGAYYAARQFETAVAETAYHQARFFRATKQDPGWIAQYRELTGRINKLFHDIRRDSAYAKYHAPDSWQESQALGRRLRNDGSNGIVYASVRHAGGECIAAFWPDVPSPPVHGRLFDYHFDGERIDIIRDTANGDLFRLLDTNDADHSVSPSRP